MARLLHLIPVQTRPGKKTRSKLIKKSSENFGVFDCFSSKSCTYILYIPCKLLDRKENSWEHKLFLKTPKKFLYVCGMGYLWATPDLLCRKNGHTPISLTLQERKKVFFLLFLKNVVHSCHLFPPPRFLGRLAAVVTYDALTRHTKKVQQSAKKNLGIIKVKKRPKILELQCIMYVSDSDFDGEERGGRDETIWATVFLLLPQRCKGGEMDLRTRLHSSLISQLRNSTNLAY